MTLLQLIKKNGKKINHVAKKVGVCRNTISNWSENPTSVKAVFIPVLAKELGNETYKIFMK